MRQRITRSKYFKDEQPRFITYVEKDQIQNLHESNPKEWTPEKLSESFPALPETIRKILKSKWVPKSVDAVINYDKQAIENWKDFKTGKLVVDPVLNEHLTKFKNRKISLTDREILSEKFVPPKMEFPKPQSTMFSSIVKDDSVNSKQPMYQEKQISQNEYPDRDPRRMAMINKTSKDMSAIQRYNIMNKEHKKKPKKVEKLTIDEFLKEKLRILYETSPEEGITLLTTYRKHIESITSEDVSANVLASTKKEAEVEKDITPNVLSSAKTEAEVEEDISPNVLASAKTEAEVKEDITPNVLSSAKTEAEVEEDITPNILTSAKKEAEVEEDISGNIVASAEKEAEVEEDITPNLLTSTKMEAEIEEDISGNILVSAEKEAEVEKDKTPNVLSSAKTEAEVEEDITPNILTSAKKEAEVEEDISGNIVASAEKEAEVEEDITPNLLTSTKMEAEIEEDISGNILVSAEKEAEVEKDKTPDVLASAKMEAEVLEENFPMVKTSPEETALTPTAKETQDKLPIELNTESSSLDTYVKEWNSSVETKFDYAKSIRIPKNVYKEGMSYRIKDCYYDADGEFLYRVPGVKD